MGDPVETQRVQFYFSEETRTPKFFKNGMIFTKDMKKGGKLGKIKKRWSHFTRKNKK